MQIDIKILELVKENKKLDAIFFLREEKKISLKEATDYVENLIKKNGLEEKPKHKVGLNSDLKIGLILCILVVFFIFIMFLREKFSLLDHRPQQQIEFEEKFNELKKLASYINANEVQMEDARKQMGILTEQTISVNEWFGTITKVEKTLFSGNGVIVSTRNPKGIEMANYFLKDLRTIPLEKIQIGTKVKFSGDFGGSDLITLNGFISSIFNDNRILIINPIIYTID